MNSASHKVDDYIESLPLPQQEVASRLRELLFENVANIEERFSYQLPFYRYYGMFAYLRAADGAVYICFYRGKDLMQVFPQLELKQRASICCVRVDSLKDIKKFEIITMITTAAAWNNEAFHLKIPLLQRRKN
jgi:hypothetical protein